MSGWVTSECLDWVGNAWIGAKVGESLSYSGQIRNRNESNNNNIMRVTRTLLR